ncbi:MAG: hypothetical protein ACLFVJ_17975 [Persicimonas sp.]
MRVKVLVLAGSLGLLVAGLVFGSEMCVQVGQQYQAGASQESDADAGEAGQAPNVTRGGVGEVNDNLGEMKEQMQEQSDERQNQLDERLERSTGGSR